MLHMMYIDAITQNFLPITGTKKIVVKITDKNKDKFSNYEVYFENFRYYDCNKFIFNIYQKHDKITKENNATEYVNKDVLYLYITKVKASKIDYDTLCSIFIDAINTKQIQVDKDTNEMYFYIPLANFYYKLKNFKNFKNITNLLSDIKFVKSKEKLKTQYDMPQNIINEINGT